jgi:hypothetical protein
MPRLQADLQLEYEGHLYELRTRGDDLELVLPSFAAAAAVAKFAVQWGPGLAAQIAPVKSVLQYLPSLRVRLGEVTLLVISPSQGLDVVLQALQRLGKIR